MDGYDAAMAQQRSRSQESGSFKVDYNESLKLEGSTEFTGYDSVDGEGVVTAVLRDGEEVGRTGADEVRRSGAGSAPRFTASRAARWAIQAT